MKQALSIFKNRGSSMVETLVALPLLLLIGLGVVQWAFIYEAKATLNYATFMAARAGAVDHANESTIKEALARSLIPLYSPDKSIEGLGIAWAKANADVNNINYNKGNVVGGLVEGFAQRTTVSILNPTTEAFDDFSTSEGKDILPNFRLWQASTELGSTSHVNIQDANLLKLEVTYQYKLKVPFVGRVIASLINSITSTIDNDPKDAWKINAKPHSLAWKLYEKADSQGRIPILASATVRMQSTTHKNGLMVSLGDTKEGDYSDLNVAEPIEGSSIPEPSDVPLPNVGDGHVLLFNYVASNEDPPTEGDNPPTEGDNPPTEGDNPPTEGDNPPTEGDNPPTEGDNPPAECEHTEPKDDDQGANDEDQSIWGSLWNEVKTGLVEGYEFVKGFWEGMKSQISDLADIITDPAEFVRGMIELGKQFVKDPPGTAKMIADALGSDVDTLVECGSYDRGRIIGEYVSPAFMLKLATKLAKFEKLADALDSTKRDFGCASFAAGTLIWTANGKLAIEQIRQGQLVQSRNDDSHADQQQAVVDTFNRKAPSYYQLTTEFETLKVTEEHPLWVQGKGWTDVKQIGVNDVVASVAGDTLILDNKKVDEPLQVYNFSVANTPSYFVGESRLWVHNAKCEFETIDGVRHIVTKIESYNGKNKVLNKPTALTVYKVNGRHTFKTDKYGRPETVTSTVELKDLDTTARNYYQQCKIGKCGADGDEGGHLIATKLGGPGEAINLVPQNFNLNRGEWKKMENEWGRAAVDGKKVEIDIQLQYTGDAKRPDKFVVTYSIDGVDYERTFKNQPGGGP